MQRGPDEWDLDTLSQVSQLRSGFHGVNGTAAVSLTRELHAGSLTKFIYTFSRSSQGHGRSQRLERDLGSAELGVH